VLDVAKAIVKIVDSPSVRVRFVCISIQPKMEPRPLMVLPTVFEPSCCGI
jgi:hypothetical protein